MIRDRDRVKAVVELVYMIVPDPAKNVCGSAMTGVGNSPGFLKVVIFDNL